MKRINTITTVIVLIVLIVAVCLVAQIARTQPFRKDGLSTEAVLEAATLKEEAIVQKRNLVWEYHNQGNSQSAIQVAEEYLKLVPRDGDIWMVLAENYMWTGKLTNAERAVIKALRVNPQSSWGLRTLAAIYRAKAEQSPRHKRKFLSQAQLKIEEALRLTPNDPWVNMEASSVYLEQGKRNEALKAIDKATKLNPEEKHFLDLREQILSGNK